MNGHHEVALSLVVYRGFSAVSRHVVTPGVVRIGRDASSDIHIDDGSVASVHAVLEVAGDGEMTVTDMGSELGTKINGRQVQRCRVAAGDRLGLGGITLIAETTATDMANNPFLSTAPAVPVDAVWSQDTEGLDEPGPDAVDVRILWGTNVLHFAQLCPPRAFTLGAVGCDFVLPDGDADDAAKSLVELRDGRPVVLVPNGGSATVRRVNGSCHTASGGEIELPHGAVATVRRPGSELVFEVSHVRAGSKPTAAFWEGTDLSAQAYTGISALIHGSLFGALAFFLPAMHSDDAETVDRDVAAAMQPYLAAIAEKEPAHEESVAELTHEAANGGGSGSQAAKESGGMGNPLSHASSPARYGIRGDTPEPKLARERALLEAAKFGMVGLLNTDGPESANAPIAAWADDRAVGHDAKSALGSMWGPSVDDVFGPGGLGLSGAGEGGGGVGTGIGIDGIADTVGHGSGDWPGGDGPGRGPGTGFGPAGRGGPGGLRNHVAGAPNPRPLPITTFNGTLPKEIVQRIVRQNFGRFRMCYEAGLRSNPGLSGRVAVAFVINREGAVSLAAADRSTDMPDQAVVSCVVRGFQNLSFPAPKDGTVQVIYPLMLAPDQ